MFSNFEARNAGCLELTTRGELYHEAINGDPNAICCLIICWAIGTLGRLRAAGTFAPGGRIRYTTETVANPVAVWRQFCAEARIEHKGDMKQPPLEQTEIFP